MRLLFFGTPDFAVPSLSQLHHAGHDILLVICQPDRPAGRGLKIQPPAVKRLAVVLGLPTFQPETLEETSVRRLADLDPEVAVVVAYGLILPPEVLRIPSKGCVNLHASLLPRFRGAAPVAHAILRGERKVGVTTLLMDAGIDTGPLLLQREDSLGESETTGEVEDRLSRLGAELLVRTLSEMERGTLTPRPQALDRGTYAPKLRVDQSRIDWRREAMQLERQIRALNPRPGASTTCRGLGVKIWRAGDCSRQHVAASPVGALLIHEGSMHVACGAGTCLEIREIQMEGRNKVTGEEALRGRWFKPGDIFGEAGGSQGGG